MAKQNKDELTVVTAMVAAQILHEVLDELKDTPYYKQKLKQVTNQFQIEITKTCDKTISAMYNADETAMVNLQEGIHEIAQKLATLDPALICELRERIKTL
jgi:hypothetical protein